MHNKTRQRLQLLGIVVLITVTVLLFENRRDPPDMVDPSGVVVGQKYQAEASENAWRYRQAADLINAGEFQAAEKIYRELVELEPNRVDAYIGLAGAQSHQLELDEARNNYAKALKLQGSNPHALYGAGAVELSSGDLQLARDYFERALKQSPDHLLSHYGMASVNYELGELEVAKKHAQRFLALSPKSALVSEMQKILDADD